MASQATIVREAPEPQWATPPFKTAVTITGVSKISYLDKLIANKLKLEKFSFSPAQNELWCSDGFKNFGEK